MQKKVPVVNQKQEPQMPTTPWRAAIWMASGKATGFWKKGVFCVRLNQEPSDNKRQEVVVGIDPGSKREAFTIKSEKHTYLNVLAETPYWIKSAVETRRNARIDRRNRKTPYKANKMNRNVGGLPPSTKARWQWKLRICNWLMKMFPITQFIIEDVCAVSLKDKRKWNRSFSPLEHGKNWFYGEIRKLGKLTLKEGHQTKAIRCLWTTEIFKEISGQV